MLNCFHNGLRLPLISFVSHNNNCACLTPPQSRNGAIASIMPSLAQCFDIFQDLEQALTLPYCLRIFIIIVLNSPFSFFRIKLIIVFTSALGASYIVSPVCHHTVPFSRSNRLRICGMHRSTTEITPSTVRYVALYHKDQVTALKPSGA